MKLMTDHLPDDPKILKKMLSEVMRSSETLAQEIELQKTRISYLEAVVQLFQHRKFGPSSEKWPGQSLLFNEAESESKAQEGREEKEVKAHKRSKPKRGPLPSELPRVDKLYELLGEDRICSCGCALREIGEDVSEQLDIVPAVIQVLRHIRKKYCCPSCEGSFRTAPMPSQPIPRSFASPGLLAYVATAKYADSLPLYRQESILKRLGIEIGRNTLSSWMIKTAELLTPLINLLEDKLFESSLIHLDETPVQVLKESGRASTTKSWMWLRARGDPGTKVILFHYDSSRSEQVPRSLLEGYSGKILTDGYAAYRKVASDFDLGHFGCMDHARRRFHEAAKGEKRGAEPSIAEQALEYFARLYAIERRYKDAGLEQRRRARQIYTKSVSAHMRRWLDRVIGAVSPKSLTGKALSYLDNQWDYLFRYIDHPDVPVSNALAENAIRPFAVGRRNWLFSDTPRGAHGSAAIYSVIETAKANGIDPYRYLKLVIEKLPAIENVGDVEALLPWNANLAMHSPNTLN